MKKLLAVIDYQNDFVIGSCGFPLAKDLEYRIYEKIKSYQRESSDVLFTLDTHYDNQYEQQETDLLKGWRLYGKTSTLLTPHTFTISKHTFGSLDLSQFLLFKQYDRVEFVGVITNICVIANVIIAQASLPEAEIWVDAKCTASDDSILHEKSLDIMESMQIKIINR